MVPLPAAVHSGPPFDGEASHGSMEDEVLCVRRGRLGFACSLYVAAGRRARFIGLVTVIYGPDGFSKAHRHAGSVFADALAGTVRSQNSATGPVRTYREGESFFEPQGSTHLTRANASRSQAAKTLVIFVAPVAARLTVPLAHLP